MATQPVTMAAVFTGDGGAVSLTSSTVSGNAAGEHGGGIFSDGGAVSLTSSIVSGNTTDGYGGGIYSEGGAISLTSSTVSGNAAGDHGGGIFTNTDLSGVTTIITNSTISGNTAVNTGGGIFNYDGLTRILNSTITGNTAAVGGGVATYGDDFTSTEVSSSIIAGNTGTTAGNDVSSQAASELNNSFVSLGFNLIGDGQFRSIDFFTDGTGGDIVGTTAAPVDALLGPLAENGGPTLTHALLVGSPAIDAGNSTLAADQRGLPRPVDIAAIANAAGGDGSDMGAVENQGNPRVLDVIVAGSGWNAAFIDAVDGLGPGQGNGLGHSLVGPQQLGTLPWLGIDTLYVVFDTDVSASLADGDIVLTGTNGGTYALGSLQYGVAGTNVVTIPISGGIGLGIDSLVLSILDGTVSDAASNALDGDWTSGQAAPSGNGVPGGQFDFFFNALPGDENGSGVVNASDARNVFASNTEATVAANARRDTNGSGQINSSDALLAFANDTQGLPAPPTPPTPPPPPIAALNTASTATSQLAKLAALDALFSNLADPRQNQVIGSRQAYRPAEKEPAWSAGQEEYYEEYDEATGFAAAVDATFAHADESDTHPEPDEYEERDTLDANDNTGDRGTFAPQTGRRFRPLARVL